MNERSSFGVHEIQEHLIPSEEIGDTFRIKVLVPPSLLGGSERFPVLYVTDGDHVISEFSNLSNRLQLLGEVPRFILVTIGYLNPRSMSRSRDLFTRGVRALCSEEIEQAARSALTNTSSDMATSIFQTDAGDFLSFLKCKLIPFISSRYPVREKDNNYYGSSAGGTFGLYTLLNRPDTFSRYVISSPGVSYDGHHFGVEWVDQFRTAKMAVNASVFMSVGELEEFDRGLERWEFVTGYYRMAKCLKRARIPGLKLTTQVFPRETHATAWALAFIHGLKEVFGPAQDSPSLI